MDKWVICKKWKFLYSAMVKTLLVGNFGARNVGDELILASALERRPNAIVMTADGGFCQRFQKKKFESVLPFPSGLRSWIRLISHSAGTLRELRGKVDMIIFPGGGLLAIKDRAWWIWGSTVIGLRKFFPQSQIVMEAQGIDHPKNDWQKFWLNQVITNVNSISVRDEASAEVVRSFGGSAEVVGDAAENFLRSKTLLLKGQRDKVLVNARAKYDGVWPKADLFVAMEPGDVKWCPADFVGKVVFPDTVVEAIELFGSAKKAVGQRLHFLIMAKVLGCEDVASLGEPYADKVSAWLERQE